ncbi:MAG: hypothetical protein HDR01_07380 [Lachnospiraceae bacterium]|nr:hypothetical protein [Lachnospiraceae bacterium]
MKKWIMAGSLIVLLFFVAWGIFEKTRPAMEVQVFQEEKLNKLLERLREKEEVQAKLTFREQVLPYDRESRTFFLPLSMEKEGFESGSFGTDMEGAEPVFLEDFTEKKKLSLMAGNEAIPFYMVEKDGYCLCYLKITGVSIMDFTSSEYAMDDGQPLFLLKVYDNLAADGKKNGKDSVRAAGEFVTNCYTTSRLRGNTSLNYEKKSLRLNLYEQKKDGSFQKKNESLLGMRTDNDWILNGLYADGSKIKDKLANDLWEQAGAEENPYQKTFGTHMEYVEVFINDAYQGLYGLMFPIDKKQLGMASVSSQVEAGEAVIERIYKKKYTAEWKAEDFQGALPDENMPDYRGGFFLKGDLILQNEEEWKPLYDLAACIEGSDEEFAGQITSLVNQENVLQNWLFYQAIGGFDNYGKNYYYAVRNRDGKPQGYFIPWDLNISFGDVYTDNPYYCKADFSVVKELIRWQPGQRMIDLNVDDSVSILKQTWKEWRSTSFSQNSILDRIDSLEQTVKGSGAYEREKERWPQGRYEEDFSQMKEFALQRLQYVDEYVEGLSE